MPFHLCTGRPALNLPKRPRDSGADADANIHPPTTPPTHTRSITTSFFCLLLLRFLLLLGSLFFSLLILSHLCTGVYPKEHYDNVEFPRERQCAVQRKDTVSAQKMSNCVSHPLLRRTLSVRNMFLLLPFTMQ